MQDLISLLFSLVVLLAQVSRIPQFKNGKIKRLSKEGS